MALSLARRMRDLRASEIRELLKVAQDPAVISFAGGLPAAELFPVAELAAATTQALLEDGGRALQYSATEGDPELRAAIASRIMRGRGVEIDPDAILVTGGSQQGLDLAGKLFLDEDDVVVCESPTYIGALGAFRVFGPRFAEVATDDEGMIPEDLERVLSRERRIKFVYVVPDFQNPTGRRWSRARREALVRLAAEREVPVLEDAPYAELCFEGEPEPSVMSLDTAGSVLHLGTFSKLLCPGLRLAWTAADPELVRRLVLIKQGTDLHTSTLAQRQVAVYLRRADLDARLERLRAAYRARRDAMIAAIAREFPPGVRHTKPRGGMFLWVELPDGLDARRVLERALPAGVAFVPGAAFFPEGGGANTMRLNFTAVAADRIAEGIARLGAVLHDVAIEI